MLQKRHENADKGGSDCNSKKKKNKQRREDNLVAAIECKNNRPHLRVP
jgi:hypothetical protein